MKLQHLLIGLLIASSPISLWGQDWLDFYHADTTQDTPVCLLPHLYFSSVHSTQLDASSQEDLAYLISLLKTYPDLKLRIRGDDMYRRFDGRRRRLNRRRVKHVRDLLTAETDLSPKRLILVPTEPWRYLSAKDEPVHPLITRRLSCECIWKVKKKKKKKKKREKQSEEAPTPQPTSPEETVPQATESSTPVEVAKQ